MTLVPYTAYRPQPSDGQILRCPSELRAVAAYSWSAVCGESMGSRVGKTITAETAESAEMIEVNDIAEPSAFSACSAVNFADLEDC